MTTFYTVLCKCGHEGKIKLRENDTPYSSSNWQSYSLQDLNGQSYTTEDTQSWEIVFKQLNPQCPKCNSLLTTDNLTFK